MFAVRSASVRFGHTLALDDVTVEVPGGSVVAVVGGDGAGKSTLLRALAGEVRLDSGTIEAPPKQRLGYLPASSGSWAALTVKQNIDFVAGIYGLAGDNLANRRRELLDRASLTPAAGRLAAQLSGGMRRKLGFIMAIVHRPALLILDEPSTGIDPVSRIDLWRLVSEAAASGAAVLMSTTYLDEAERAARLVVLDNGKILVQGSYDQVRAGFTGVVTQTADPVRADWAWRRGRVQHEYWPGASPPAGATVIAPDLQDIVIALSLAKRNAVLS